MTAETTRASVSDILHNNGSGTTSDNIDSIFKTSPIGQISSAIGNSFYGINHRQTPGAIQINKDYFGLTFFTRPQMNLTTANIRSVRKLTPLLTNEPASIQRIIRCLLDPRLAIGSKPTNDPRRGGDGTFNSPFVDNQQAFIPILTNHLLSMSGWPEIIAPTMTSTPGIYQEAYSFVDGVTENYSTYDISANFRNIPGDPITSLFLVWAHYASLVYQGVMVPYPDKIVENEIDYNTRIYRLVLNSSKQYVTKIAACGAAFPISSPISNAFNFEHDKPINSSNDQISVSFRCMGATYQDDILVDEFNRTTILFNDRLKDGYREKEYVKIPIEALGLFNNRGYPRINPHSYELEWWISNDDYNYTMSLPNQNNTKNNNVSTENTDFGIPNYRNIPVSKATTDLSGIAGLDPSKINIDLINT